ncbi:hypothetical protein BTS2_0550 [Bacillus sp. TS-2]|nr:hypothetical protein BTS2_0550 [Bacillus sp. TS-2]
MNEDYIGKIVIDLNKQIIELNKPFQVYQQMLKGIESLQSTINEINRFENYRNEILGSLNSSNFFTNKSSEMNQMIQVIISNYTNVIKSLKSPTTIINEYLSAYDGFKRIVDGDIEEEDVVPYEIDYIEEVKKSEINLVNTDSIKSDDDILKLILRVDDLLNNIQENKEDYKKEFDYLNEKLDKSDKQQKNYFIASVLTSFLIPSDLISKENIISAYVFVEYFITNAIQKLF